MATEEQQLRVAFGRFATGVTVVTSRNRDGGPHGATVTAFTAVSLGLALCQVTLARTSTSCRNLDGHPFAVNVLGARQIDVARHFAGGPAGSVPEWAQRQGIPYLVGCAFAPLRPHAA